MRHAAVRAQCVWSDGVVAEVGEEAAGAAAEREAAAAADRDRDVAGSGRGSSENGDPAEPVEVRDADAVELRVAAEQREQLELARRRSASSPAAARIASRISSALVVRADDVARAGSRGGRARTRSACVAVHVRCGPGAKNAPEYVSFIVDRDVDVDAADAVDERREAGEVDVDDVGDRHADQPADARSACRAGRPACAPPLILSPCQHVSRGMSSIVAVLRRRVHADEVQRVAARAADTGARVVADEQR